ncbi:protein phosphatase methylesterase 1-like isoform X2 [Dysidea avara]|uniref:protein phosphatase methylesterase 1-like isoform X2 n=1 Tax=Dysidea avara TaxID=196820 RepID=UPI00332C1F70
MSSLQKELLKKSLPPTASIAGRKRKGHQYTPLPWTSHFDGCQDVKVHSRGSFRVYLTGDTGPVVFLLHGGGHSAFSWCLFTSALMRLCECQVVAMDIRGHGSTMTAAEDDLSIDTLIRDVEAVVTGLYGNEAPPLILMGHSMGGAIVLRSANRIASLVGVVVIDVVEGTAMDSLSGMQSFLSSRPKCFRSLEHAIEWSIRSGQLRNVTSARISIPGQVKRQGDAVSVDVREEIVQSTADGVATTTTSSLDTISEDDHAMPAPPPPTSTVVYDWRVDLSKTEPYWRGWYEGMSQVFLSCPGSKLLILAGVDRLDKELTIAHMQGSLL